MKKMRHNTKISKRKADLVVHTHVELTTTINKRLEKYADDFKMSKRQIIEQALFMWLNDRDREYKKS